LGGAFRFSFYLGERVVSIENGGGRADVIIDKRSFRAVYSNK
jgi:hypothetical protein